MVIRDVAYALVDIIKEAFNKKNSTYSRFIKPIVGVVCITLALVALYGGYRWYVVRRESLAHEAFNYSMAVYQNAVKENKQELWSEVQSSFNAAYQRHKGSRLAPIFHVFESEALIQQGKKAQALVVMDSALKEISPESSLYYLYKIKHVLMEIDADDQQVQKAAVKKLEALADNLKNTQIEETLYYLGMYYSEHGEEQKSHKVFKRLIELGSANTTRSPYVQLAQQKIL